MKKRKTPLWLLAVAAVLIIGVLAARGLTRHPSAGPAPSAAAPPPPAVVVTAAIQSTVPIYTEGVAQTQAVTTVDLRAQVAGTLEQVSFKEGDAVNQGQVLFVIDPRPYEVALQSAQGQLATAQANLTQALQQRQLQQAQAQLATAQANLQQAKEQVNVKQAQAQLDALKATYANAREVADRDKYLVAQGAVAQQQFDNDDATARAAAASVDAQQAVVNNTVLSQKIAIAQAEASVRAAEAAVHDAALQTRIGIETARAAESQAQAGVSQAELNLEYTTIRAPSNGVIGVLQVNRGNWVQINTVLDSMSSVDPMKAQFHLNEVTFLQLVKQARAEGANAQTNPSFQLILADGTVYPHAGTFRTLNNTVDPQTGTILVEASFPNGDHILRPGMYARVRVKLEDRPNTVLVPQAAVLETQGTSTVFVVGPDNTVTVRTITHGDAFGEFFPVLSGLQPGERVIVEGLQKVRPGTPVRPTLRPAPALPTGGGAAGAAGQHGSATP